MTTGTKLIAGNFNPRAGGGYVEYCTEGYLAGKRIAVGRFKYASNKMANKKRMITFLTLNFTLEEIQSPNYWDLMIERGWDEYRHTAADKARIAKALAHLNGLN